MSLSILTVGIETERDTVAARQRARQVARSLGFDNQDQTRISTAVSELARNAFNYAGGGRVEYLLEGRTAPQLFIIKVTDSGPGIADLDEILEGRYKSTTGMGVGIIGARRLMDQFEVDSHPGRGTTIWLKKLLPKRAPVLGQPDLAAITKVLASERPQDAFEELRYQNRELLAALDEVRSRQTELARVNRELEDTNRGVVALYAELDEKADHLRRADELKTRFLSNMSHEFRSPLNSILALSGLLLNRTDGDLTSEQQHQVEYVKRAAHDLLELVNDLLDSAKVESGKVIVKPLEFHVADLFAGLRGMLRPLFLNQSVELIFEDVDHLPTLYSDEAKISQILRNFISNALKFTEKGEVRINASLEGDAKIAFSVSDTGIGIAPENLSLIFQDFAQVDHPIQRRVKGTGLGLPLSKKLAALLEGEVDVRSQLGMGSVFTLLLPVRYRQAVAEFTVSEDSWSPNSDLVPVLVVEDSPEMMMAYQRILAGSGFQALPAVSTRDAASVLDRIRPAAIILDIVLRSESSWNFLAAVKADPKTTDIPLIVASTTEDRGKAFHLGADAYLLKPMESDVLLRELRMVTGWTGPDVVSPVLLIDDNERERYLLKRHLKKWSVHTIEAASGLEGLDRARREQPRVIFLDLEMPGLDGFETLDYLKADAATQAIPVVIFTSQTPAPAERIRLLEKAVSILNKEDLAAVNWGEILRLVQPDNAAAAPEKRT